MRKALADWPGGTSLAGAREGLSRPQKQLLLALVLGSGFVALVAPAPLALFMLAASALFLLVIAVLLGAAIESWSLAAPAGTAGSPGDDRARAWPRYTILIPLYREGAVAAQLMEAMGALDYPQASLELLLLVESDDPGTAAALRPLIPDHGRLIIVPDGAPRTKPRALNHGLGLATGDYVTVFDAEDIPEPDQLKRAVLMFEQASAQVLCLQGRLAIDNIADGWLPLMEAIEYMALYDSLKCGLSVAAMPVALGGTSNHFRRRELIALGGWDAWNVTEDADLGLRIARRGGRVLDLPSTTHEEAPIAFDGWLRQRRRWFKGWLQTGVTHARNPRDGIRSMGLAAWLVGQLSVLGLVLSALTFPFFSVWVGWNYWTGHLFDNGTALAFTSNSVAIAVAFLGWIAMAAPALIGLWRRRLWQLAPWVATMPIYLMIVSYAAWLALWDLQRRPFHWSKTEHGLGRRHQTVVRSRR